MKKIFQIIGLMCLVAVSFIYTEKSVQVVRQKDPIMIELEKNKDSFKINEIDATIKDDEVIPGCYGLEVNVDESYENMKKYGLYNETMIKYKTIKPNISIEDIYDKYIVKGNKVKNAVSLIFVVDENTSLDKVYEVLEETKTKATFFMYKDYIDNNEVIVNKLVSIGSEIEHLDYNENKIVYSNKLISKIDKEAKYCYAEKNDNNILNLCKMYSLHTVKPVILKNNININLHQILDSGLIVSLKVNRELNYSLEYIISYINQKGYKIMRLDEHLDEKINLKN